MQKQIIVTAASYAATTNAMKIHTNSLVQVSDSNPYTPPSYHDIHDHGTSCYFDPYGAHYGYGGYGGHYGGHNPHQCLQEKVDRTLEAMVQRVNDHKVHCELRAEDLRNQIVGGAEELREYIQYSLANARADAEGRLAEKLASSTATIGTAVAAATRALLAEQEAAIARVTTAREETEQKIKELVYNCNQGYGYCDQYKLKEDIKALVDAYDQLIEDNVAAGRIFAAEQEAIVDSIIASEIKCLADDIASEIKAWNELASEGIASLDSQIQSSIDEMDYVIADKTDAINKIIANLENNFLEVFWDTLIEIQEHIEYYERKPLVHKALYKKEEFLAAVSDLRDLLLENLAATRKILTAELGEQRADLVSSTNKERDALVAQANQLREDLDAVAKIAQAEIDALISALTDEARTVIEEQQHKLEKFVYQIASYIYKPRVYQPQDKTTISLVVKTIENLIATYGDAIFATHDATVAAELATMNQIKQNQMEQLAEDNIIAQNALDKLTIILIERITDARIALEAELLISQDAQEANDEAARDVDQVALVTTKNDLWKDLSWLMRKLHGGHGYGHGRGAFGAGYGFGRDGRHSRRNRHAQIGLGELDDHDDVYGYHGFGYGFDGKAEATEIINKMADAQAETIQRNEDRINASEQALNETLTAAWAFYDNVLYEKEAEFNAAVDEQDAQWKINVAERTVIVESAIAYARANIAVAEQVKKEALDQLEKEIRWSITSIYTHVHNKPLADLMDTARAEADAAWAERKVAYDLEMETCQNTWDDHVESETASLDANTAEERERCDNARAEQRELFTYYVDNAYERFALWAASEREQMDSFIADCQDAWIWILKSYCLVASDDDHDHNDHYANDCGYNIEIGGFKKGVEIEIHDTILSYGQPNGDDLDIKHLDDVAQRIDYAVTFVMQGVAQVASVQLALVEDEIAAIHAQVEAEREALESALTNRLNDSIATMDALVQELTDALRARQTAAEAAVDADRETYTQAVRDLRELTLEIIADLVWQLGYNKYDRADLPEVDFRFSLEEGEHHGTHENSHPYNQYAQTDFDIIVDGDDYGGYGYDSHGYGYDSYRAYEGSYPYGRDEEYDVEIRRLIVAQKEIFEAEIIKTITTMDQRVVQEQEDGDAAAEAAWQTFEDEARRLTDEMNQAITDAIASFEDTLAYAKVQVTAETDRAEAVLEEFLQARLAAWQQKYEWEKNRAQWQKDSYFRYNLLRLLQAKDDAVNDAINQARADFAAAMKIKEGESMEYRQAQRGALQAFTADTRVALADAIAVDRQMMADEIDERARTLDEFLADQIKRLIDDMEECREIFRVALKKFYNHQDLTDKLILNKDAQAHDGQYPYAPYTHYQHKNFIYKLQQYLREELDQLDAQLLAMQESTATQVTNISEQATLQATGLEQDNINQREANEAELSSLARKLLEGYALTQESELTILRELRQVSEEAALTKAEELKKIIVYSTHVLRFATKQIIGPPNGLTGIDELDARIYDNDHYLFELAQIDNKHLHDHHGDEHDEKLKEALAQAKQDFDDMIQACRDDFQEAVDLDKKESDARKAQVDQDVWDAAGAAQVAQEELAASSKATLNASNDERFNDFEKITQATLNAFIEEVDGLIEKIDSWLAERIEWVNQLYDEYTKAHLISDLEKKRELVVYELEARKQQAQEIIESMRIALAEILATIEDELWTVVQSQVEGLAIFSDALKADTDVEGASIAAEFAQNADAEAVLKNQSMDILEQQWAYWLKQVYNYAPYNPHSYDEYQQEYDYGVFPYFDYYEEETATGLYNDSIHHSGHHH